MMDGITIHLLVTDHDQKDGVETQVGEITVPPGSNLMSSMKVGKRLGVAGKAAARAKVAAAGRVGKVVVAIPLPLPLPQNWW